MKLENQFDKVIRDKLKFHQTEPPEYIWEKIEIQLPGRNYKNIFSLVGILTISFTFTLLFLRLSDLRHPVMMAKNELSTLNASKKIGSIQSNAIQPSNLSKIYHQNSKKRYNPNTFIFQAALMNEFYPKYMDSNKSLDQIDSSLSSKALNAQPEKTGPNTASNYLDQNISKLSIPEKIESVFGRYISENYGKYKTKNACLIQFDAYKKKYFIEIFNSLDVPIKHLSGIGDDQLKYIHARKNTESLSLAFSAGFRTGLTISRDLEIMAGGQFSQINEQFDYTDPESSQTKTIIVKSYIKNSTGETIDSITTQQTIQIPGTQTYKIQNYYRFIDIPVVLGYKIFSKRRFSVFANAGVIANIKFMQKGAILDDDAVTISKFNENQTNNVFLRNSGFSSYTALNIKYALSSGLQLSLEPNLRHQFSSLTNDDYPIEQRYTVLGIQGGLRFIF